MQLEHLLQGGAGVGEQSPAGLPFAAPDGGDAAGTPGALTAAFSQALDRLRGHAVESAPASAPPGEELDPAALVVVATSDEPADPAAVDASVDGSGGDAETTTAAAALVASEALTAVPSGTAPTGASNTATAGATILSAGPGGDAEPHVAQVLAVEADGAHAKPSSATDPTIGLPDAPTKAAAAGTRTDLASAAGHAPGEATVVARSEQQSAPAASPGDTGVQSTTDRATTIVQPPPGTSAAGQSGHRSSGTTPPPVDTPPQGDRSASGEPRPAPHPLAAAGPENGSREDTRAPGTPAAATQTVARDSGHAAAVVSPAPRTESEGRTARVETRGFAHPDGSTTRVASAVGGEGPALVNGLSESAIAESTPLRTASEAFVATALPTTMREAIARQGMQVASPPSGAPAGTEDITTTLAPGTPSQAPATSPASVLARIDQPTGFAALAERIVDALHLSAVRGGSEIRLRMDPPGLGHIDVRVRLQDDGVRAMIVAEHEATRALISGNQHLLEAALGRSELRLSGFSVDLSLDQGATDFQEAGEGADQEAALADESTAVEAQPVVEDADTTLLHPGRLSLRV